MQTCKHILLVDDDPFVREMIGEILSDLDYISLYAEHGEEALQLINTTNVDAIITDMHMPVMDGMTLIQQIRVIHEDIPIIILTADSEISTAIEAIRNGADDYLIKGSSISETLPIALAKVMQFYELKLENKELILDLSKKNAELERLAFLDGLTGVSNRRHFDIILRSEWEMAIKNRKMITLVMTDIDTFKAINDSLGHAYGDLCIQVVARTLNRALPQSGDFLSRYGGDEFAIILPETSPSQAHTIAEKIRLMISNLQITNPETNTTHSITMSFGVYGLVPDKDEDFSSLLEGADKALYKAKHLGRNQVQEL